MSLNERATVTLTVNNAQAKSIIDQTEKQIRSLSKEIDALKAKGSDPKTIESKRKQLKTLQKQLDENRSATEGVARAMASLDKATPRQLEKSLRTLNRQLKEMVPGSEVWKSHVSQIKALKAQLDILKSAVKEQEGVWTRFSKWWYNSGQAVAAIIAMWKTGMSTLRGYVDDYAQMDEALANTRKFTGMAEDDARALNDEFKRMDTRSSREQLNALAQEAGRLGKSTREEVIGFVEAADIINVALDELGDGATQQIAKLTDIFGVEKIYGTRDAMLKTSSVVNDLSQSCTASAPYIVEFSKRLAGVGAQAKMTIPEIMALGAVLDANGQAVEMSATAVSQTIMKLFQKPREIARAVGLDVKEFTKTLQRNTTEGLMVLLEQLNKIGGDKAIAALSPLFKDLGLDGARMSSVLSVCAGRIDMIREKMQEANAAFEKGTSTLNEYTVFNNTAQASIDKARKRFHELSVELGENLYPLMQYMYSSGSALAQILKILTNFIIKNRTELLIVAGTIALYTTAIKLNAGWQTILAKKIAITTAASLGLHKAMTFVKALLAPLTLAFRYLCNGMELNYGMMQKYRAAMAAMNWQSWTAGVLGLVTAIVTLSVRLYKLLSTQRLFNEITKKANAAIADEVSKIHILNNLSFASI